MKKWTAYVAIISLLLVGIFVTYKEAFARPYDCGYLEFYCIGTCMGEWYLGQCEDCGSYIQCEFCCTVGYPYWPCIFDGSTCGICWL